jgi:uncharacterized protein DUF6438
MAGFRFPVVFLLAGFLYAGAEARCQPPPVKLTTNEAHKNLIDPVPVIRAAGADPSPMFASVQVTLIVDTRGQVRSAEPVARQWPAPPHLEAARALQSSLVPRAVEIARALKYRPFVQNGIAVEVQYDEYVRILPLEKLPTTHVAFPRVDDLKSVEFWLKRDPCFGSCPVYDVHITGEGVVSYRGQPFDGLLGELNKRATPQLVQRLLESFQKADFFSLDDRYEVGATDLPTATVGLRIGAVTKIVADYGGDEVGMPEAVTNLEREIDAIADSVKGSGVVRPK